MCAITYYDRDRDDRGWRLLARQQAEILVDVIGGGTFGDDSEVSDDMSTHASEGD